MSYVQSYSFDERLKASDGHCTSFSVEEIVSGNIVGSVSVHRSHQSNDRMGTDWWVECKNGTHLSIDAKVRDIDYAVRGADDLALETWSVVEQKKIGWTRDTSKRCDFILWLWKDTGRWCLVPFPMLCTVFISNFNEWTNGKYKVSRQHTANNGSGYHSECVFVPRREVWKAIYERFGGAPAPMPRP